MLITILEILEILYIYYITKNYSTNRIYVLIVEVVYEYLNLE